MKRTATTLFALFVVSVASVALTSQADAALRVPQEPVLGGALQGYFVGIGEAINVNTDQEHAQRWSSTISGTSSFTVQVELSVNAASNSIGVYNAALPAPPLYQVFPNGATTDWFATASFRTGPVRLIVNLFDPLATLMGTTVYLGADGTDFGFYLQGPGGLFYSQDARNTGSAVQMLAYKGTGFNAGNFFLAFEDRLIVGGDRDFDDCLIFMESVNPTPVNSTSWGQLKARFR